MESFFYTIILFHTVNGRQKEENKPKFDASPPFIRILTEPIANIETILNQCFHTHIKLPNFALAKQKE